MKYNWFRTNKGFRKKYNRRIIKIIFDSKDKLRHRHEWRIKRGDLDGELI